jgi:hypothetical protein
MKEAAECRRKATQCRIYRLGTERAGGKSDMLPDNQPGQWKGKPKGLNHGGTEDAEFGKGGEPEIVLVLVLGPLRK